MSNFYRDKKKKEGRRYMCKFCLRIKEKLRDKTKEGLITVFYKSQRYSSKQRNHPMPTYTKEELKNWLLNQHKFHLLFKKWSNSNFEKNLKPSIDRIKDSLPYTLTNIQLGTWQQNKQSQYDDSRKGIIGNKLRPIQKLDLDNNQIKSYISINQAVRQTGLAQGNIWKVLNGIGQTLGGFKWKYIN